MGKVLYLIVGGAAGTLARYYLVGTVYHKLGANFPFGTLLVNLTGCFLVGLFSTTINDKFFFGPDSKTLLMAGFCGSYTTFSALMLETSNLMVDGEMFGALVNVVASVVAGFIFLRLGVLAGNLI